MNFTNDRVSLHAVGLPGKMGILILVPSPGGYSRVTKI